MSTISSRRRRSPWIHRWSRPLIGGVATLGALNTLYLTVTRFLGSEAACPTDGCVQVLASRYATLFGPEMQSRLERVFRWPCLDYWPTLSWRHSRLARY